MVKRIKELMNRKRLTPSAFADKIGVGRAIISHILSERNKVSLDVVMRILEAFPDISTDWLIKGDGQMYTTVDPAPILPFSDTDNKQNRNVEGDDVNVQTQQEEELYDKDLPVENNRIRTESHSSISEDFSNLPSSTNVPFSTSVFKTNSNREVSKIIIYYNDKTYQSFSPEE